LEQQKSRAQGVENLLRETSIEILGTVEKPPEGAYAKWSGLELQAEYWEIVGISDADLEDKFNKVLFQSINLLFSLLSTDNQKRSHKTGLEGQSLV